MECVNGGSECLVECVIGGSECSMQCANGGSEVFNVRWNTLGYAHRMW